MSSRVEIKSEFLKYCAFHKCVSWCLLLSRCLFTMSIRVLLLKFWFQKISLRFCGIMHLCEGACACMSEDIGVVMHSCT